MGADAPDNERVCSACGTELEVTDTSEAADTFDSDASDASLICPNCGATWSRGEDTGESVPEAAVLRERDGAAPPAPEAENEEASDREISEETSSFNSDDQQRETRAAGRSLSELAEETDLERREGEKRDEFIQRLRRSLLTQKRGEESDEDVEEEAKEETSSLELPTPNALGGISEPSEPDYEAGAKTRPAEHLPTDDDEEGEFGDAPSTRDLDSDVLTEHDGSESSSASPSSPDRDASPEPPETSESGARDEQDDRARDQDSSLPGRPDGHEATEEKGESGLDEDGASEEKEGLFEISAAPSNASKEAEENPSEDSDPKNVTRQLHSGSLFEEVSESETGEPDPNGDATESTGASERHEEREQDVSDSSDDVELDEGSEVSPLGHSSTSEAQSEKSDTSSISSPVFETPDRASSEPEMQERSGEEENEVRGTQLLHAVDNASSDSGAPADGSSPSELSSGQEGSSEASDSGGSGARRARSDSGAEGGSEEISSSLHASSGRDVPSSVESLPPDPPEASPSSTDSTSNPPRRTVDSDPTGDVEDDVRDDESRSTGGASRDSASDVSSREGGRLPHIESAHELSFPESLSEGETSSATKDVEEAISSTEIEMEETSPDWETSLESYHAIQPGRASSDPIEAPSSASEDAEPSEHDLSSSSDVSAPSSHSQNEDPPEVPASRGDTSADGANDEAPERSVHDSELQTSSDASIPPEPEPEETSNEASLSSQPSSTSSDDSPPDHSPPAYDESESSISADRDSARRSSSPPEASEAGSGLPWGWMAVGTVLVGVLGLGGAYATYLYLDRSKEDGEADSVRRSSARVAGHDVSEADTNATSGRRAGRAIERARGRLHRAAAVDPSDPDLQLEVAERLARRGDPREASQIYDVLWKQGHHRDDLEFLRTYLDVLREAKRPERFRAMTVEAIQLAEDATPWNERFQASLQRDEALQSYDPVELDQHEDLEVRTPDDIEFEGLVLSDDQGPVFLFAPETSWRRKWRDDIAAWRLCRIMACPFEIPRTRPARISREALRARAGDDVELSNTTWRWSPQTGPDGNSARYLYGSLRDWPGSVARWPIEQFEVWRPWLRAGVETSRLETPVREAWSDFQSLQNGRLYRRLLEEVDGDQPVRPYAAQLSGIIVFDYLTNHWGRFRDETAAYGAANHFADGRFVTLRTDTVFQTRKSRRVRGRFEWISRLSRDMVTVIRLLERPRISKLLYPDASTLEREKLEVFWSQRDTFLDRVDRLTRRFGRSSVLAFP